MSREGSSAVGMFAAEVRGGGGGGGRVVAAISDEIADETAKPPMRREAYTLTL